MAVALRRFKDYILSVKTEKGTTDYVLNASRWYTLPRTVTVQCGAIEGRRSRRSEGVTSLCMGLWPFRAAELQSSLPPENQVLTCFFLRLTSPLRPPCFYSKTADKRRRRADIHGCCCSGSCAFGSSSCSLLLSSAVPTLCGLFLSCGACCIHPRSWILSWRQTAFPWAKLHKEVLGGRSGPWVSSFNFS